MNSNQSVKTPFSAKKIKWFASFIAGPFAAIAIFLITNHGFNVDVNSISPLLWAIVSYLMADGVARAIESLDQEAALDAHLSKIDNRISSSGERTVQTVRSMLNVSHVRDTVSKDQIGMSLRHASHVKNTFIGIGEITGDTSPIKEQVFSHYKEVLSRSDSTWEDIVGMGELMDGRFDTLRIAGQGQFKGRHDVFVLNTHAPLLNFLICGPRDSTTPTELYFGWIKNTAASIDIFYSTDQKMIALFNNYFDLLKNTRGRVTHINVDYGKTINPIRESAVHRLRGVWLSISGAAKYLAQEGRPPNITQNELASYAIIEFYYDDGWHVQGRTFSFPDHVPLYNFTSEMCIFVRNTVYYNYRNTSEFSGIEASGIGVYSVSESRDVLSGYYVRSGQPRISALRAKKVHAERINDRNYIRSELVSVLSIPASVKT